jgi:hypothetical protein
MTFVDSRSRADPVDEVRDGKSVRRGQHQQSVATQMVARSIEKGARVRDVLDHLARPDDIEASVKVHGLRVGDYDCEAARPGALGKLRIELDADDLRRDRRDQRVHPIGPVHTRSGADVEYAAAGEEMTHTGKPVDVRSRLPIPRLQRVLRDHVAERTTRPRRCTARMSAALIAIMAAAACSGGVTDASTPTPAPCSTATTAPSASPAKTVVPIDGIGDRRVGLPGNVSLPLIVHAHHNGSGSFVVRGVDASGSDTHVLGTALGAYDGTFAVGFVDACATPTVALHVATSGRWHLDIADARLAPRYVNGVAGRGDSVLSYIGKAAKALMTYTGRSRFDVTTYGAEGPKLLARSTGAFRGIVSIPRGPVFVVVTADSAWTIRPS